jgi:hypothetical protein
MGILDGLNFQVSKFVLNEVKLTKRKEYRNIQDAPSSSVTLYMFRDT